MHPILFALLCTLPFIGLAVVFYLKATPKLEAMAASKTRDDTLEPAEEPG